MDIYIRVSRTGDREEEEATEVYETQCREWADRNGVEVEEVVDDTNVSGSVAVADRGLERLVQRVESGESEGIITPYLDRFGRDLIEGALALKRVSEAGGKLVAVRDGFDSTDPGSQLIFNVRMSIAQDYLTRVRENFKTANDRAVERGVWMAPRIPLGYDRDAQRRLVVNEAEAEVVREAFKRRAGGESFSSLTRWINEECGTRKIRGASMSRTGVRRMIANRVYVGEGRDAYGRGGDPLVIPDHHDPILTEQQWQAAQFKHPFSPRNGRAAGARLRGLVFCATCGKRCKVGASGPKDRRKTNYVCTGPGCSARASILTEKLDAEVEFQLMQAAAAHEPHVEAVILGDTRYQNAQQAVEDAKQVLDEFRDDVDIQRTLGTTGFAKGLKVRREKLKAAQRALREVRPPTTPPRRGAPADTAEAVEAAIATDSNARFIDKVVLEPNGPGPFRSAADRAEVYWVGAEEPYAPDYPDFDPAGK